jgi:hypothetical protein
VSKATTSAPKSNASTACNLITRMPPNTTTIPMRRSISGVMNISVELNYFISPIAKQQEVLYRKHLPTIPFALIFMLNNLRTIQ